jgi:hypothetical protein
MLLELCGTNHVSYVVALTYMDAVAYWGWIISFQYLVSNTVEHVLQGTINYHQMYKFFFLYRYFLARKMSNSEIVCTLVFYSYLKLSRTDCSFLR